MTIKIGDRVTWRSGKSKSFHDGRTVTPIGIANCLVKALETSPEHGECALLGHWLFKQPFADLDGVCDPPNGTAWAKVADLELEEPNA